MGTQRLKTLCLSAKTALLGCLFFVVLSLHGQGDASEPHASAGASKTGIHIAYPTGSTQWTAPGEVEISWDTQNIPAEKTIKFYLSRNDMVIQELGIFQNSGHAEGIRLHAGLPSDNSYRVIGIELFPDNKFSIAKFATPLFTIHKKPKENATPKAPETPGENATVSVSDSTQTPPLRNEYKGRGIHYVKTLEVAGPDLTIHIWDHGRKDGDIVSIYLNGEPIVQKYALEYHKKSFSVSVDPNKPSDLFLYAHNLGKFPPNTVSLEISDGEKSEDIVLNSDLKSCEAILIKVRE